MAEKYHAIQWFLRELPTLKEKGLVDDLTEQNLREHYTARLSNRKGLQSYFILMMGIIGAMMLAGGAILAIAYNWDMYSKLTRILISAIPLAAGFAWGLTALIRNSRRSQQEGAALLTAAGIITLLAMTSQIYHLGGDFNDFMVIVLALTLPLIYVFNAIGLATLYTFCLFFTIDNDYSMLCGVSGILGILPFFVYHLRKDTAYCTWIRYLFCVLALFGMRSCIAGEGNPVFTCFAVGTLGVMAGSGTELKLRQNPWLPLGFLFLTGLFCALSIAGDHIYAGREFELAEPIFNYWIFTGLVLAGIVYRAIRHRPETEHIMLLVGLGLLLPGFFPQSEWLSPGVKIVSFLYAVAWGIVLLCKGFKQKEAIVFNGGILMIASQFVVRFFNDDIGTLYRAGAFIIVGLCFIIANVIFARKMKQEEGGAA